MRGNSISRGMGIAVAALSLGMAATHSEPANAQTAYCWINAKDGTPVPTSDLGPFGSHKDPLDPNHATINGAGPATGFPNGVPSVTFVRGPDGSWINSKDGTPVPTSDLGPFGSHKNPLDPNHATINGAGPAIGFPNGVPSVTFVRVPCPPTSTAAGTNRTPGISPDGNSGIRLFASVEGGFGGARAFYDDLSIAPRSFIGGASVGLRTYQPYNMFFGAQVSVLGTDLTKEAVPGFSVGMRWGVPVDIQVGRTIQTGAMPVSVYGFAGPMWGGTRVSSFGTTDYFTLFGATAGVGVDLQLNQNWSVGAKARAFTLSPSDRMSEGQHVQGGSLTFNVSYGF
jgi:hypothetical protein